MTQMESPKRKLQKKNDYQRHKLFRKIKRRRKAQAEAEQQIAEKQLRKKLKLPKFDRGEDELSTYKKNALDIINDSENTTHSFLKPYLKMDKESMPYVWKALVGTQFGLSPIYLNNTNDNGFNSGKDIHIKKSKRGTFTKAAKQHGMSVQSFANKVLRNPSKYSAAMRKKANFAHNAASWKH